MADPLSILGAVVTVGTVAASVSQQVVSFVSEFKSAPSSVLSLAKELSVLCRTLAQLESTLKRKSQAREGLAPDLSANWRMRIKWMLEKEEVLRIRKQLGMHMDTLNTNLVLII